MKKLFIFLLLIIHLNTFAFTKGVKGGMNYTIPQPLSGYENNFSGNFGYTLGGFLNFNLIDKLFLNTELMLNSWQYEFKGENNYDGKYTSYSDYKTLDLNILIQYNFFNGFYFDIGFFWGYPTIYETQYKFINHSSTGTAGPDSKLNVYGLVTGISYKYNHLLFDLRYLYNASPFLDKNELGEICELMKDEEGCQLDKFHQFQLLVGYEF